MSREWEGMRNSPHGQQLLPFESSKLHAAVGLFFDGSSHVYQSPLSAINLWGRSGRGHCRKISANFRESSANFPQNFRTLSWRNKTHFFANFREFSAEFPQTFRKNPFANDPISELLTLETLFESQDLGLRRSFGVTINKGWISPHIRLPITVLAHTSTLF